MEYTIVYYGSAIVILIATICLIIWGCEMISQGYGDHDASYLWAGLAIITVGLDILLFEGMSVFHWFAPIVGPR